jgi:AcrR family transcriptional regulator
MLNSVGGIADTRQRRRLSAQDRRRQLLGIGLSKIVETPIQDLSMDEVAAEAGISRSLLFHYFPTKTDFYLACIAAAGRRMLRNVAPPDDVQGRDRVAAMVTAMIEQVDRRRDFYLAFVHGQGALAGASGHGVVEVYDSVRSVVTERVVEALELDPVRAPVVRAWWAYVEDRALTWSGEPAAVREVPADALSGECVAALAALLQVAGARVSERP